MTFISNIEVQNSAAVQNGFNTTTLGRKGDTFLILEVPERNICQVKSIVCRMVVSSLCYSV